MSKFVEDHKEDWAREFAYDLNLKYKKAYNDMVSMACTTMVYHIADNFQDGALREEILKFADCGMMDFVTLIPEDDGK